MYSLNKIVSFACNPVFVGLMLIVLALLFQRKWLGWFAILWLWFVSTSLCNALLGLPLEHQFISSQDVSVLPKADAIVVLGGSISKIDCMCYPDMHEGADRLWHAARLWRAGKAPRVVVSGRNDFVAAVPLLLDLGVPAEAIVVDNESRNTYENSRYTERLLADCGGSRVLLVTSAWHMPRALGNFSCTSLSVVPAPCDFSICNVVYDGNGKWWNKVAPSSDSLARSGWLIKEWIGRLARR